MTECNCAIEKSLMSAFYSLNQHHKSAPHVAPNTFRPKTDSTENNAKETTAKPNCMKCARHNRNVDRHFPNQIFLAALKVVIANARWFVGLCQPLACVSTELLDKTHSSACRLFLCQAAWVNQLTAGKTFRGERVSECASYTDWFSLTLR